MPKIAVIGSGFSGLSAAAYLAKAGHDVHILEKNEQPGGRARQLKTDNGYAFDMGPSWYWMPDVIERFFNDFDSTASQHYDLKLLDPAFDVVFGKDDTISIPASFKSLCSLFEWLEPGSKGKLHKFMKGAEYKYNTGMGNLVYKPGLSLTEFIDPKLILGLTRLDVFSSFSKHVRKYFTHPRILAIMEFPVLFLGAMPQDTPALYSLMNYAGLKLGTWYPRGGFASVVSAMADTAKRQGATLHLGAEVQKIEVSGNKVTHLVVNGTKQTYDAVIASADYQHVENKLLDNSHRNYGEPYWDQRTLAPSCLIVYLGVKKTIPGLKHHTLFFDEDLEQHARDIYKTPQWPAKPLFYACCPSKSDDTVAPEGHENIFLLMPLAPGLTDTEDMREKYFRIMMSRLEMHTGENIMDSIDYKKSYCVKDFVQDYNSYKGNAYGLANTLRQTANLKPSIRNKHVSNLFYAGQLTVPGPGVPPSIISGKIAAQQLIKLLDNV